MCSFGREPWRGCGFLYGSVTGRGCETGAPLFFLRLVLSLRFLVLVFLLVLLRLSFFFRLRFRGPFFVLVLRFVLVFALVGLLLVLPLVRAGQFEGAVVERVGEVAELAVRGGSQRLLAGVQGLAAKLIAHFGELGHLLEFAEALRQELTWLKAETAACEVGGRRERETALLGASQYVTPGHGGRERDFGRVLHELLSFPRALAGCAFCASPLQTGCIPPTPKRVNISIYNDN